MIDFSKIGKLLGGDNLMMIVYGTISTIILAVVGTVVGLILGIFIAYGKNVKIKETDNKVIKTLKSFLLNVLLNIILILKTKNVKSRY